MKTSADDSLEQALCNLLENCPADKAPGIFVFVSKQDQPLAELSTGLANVQTGQKIDRHTNLRMASVSKQFTAMGIALLERAGQLSFQSPLSAFFPAFGERGRHLTVHQLLTHTSGLPDYESLVEENRETQVSDAEVLELVASSRESFFLPGTRFRYSNTGYVLLGLLIERVTGQPFSHFMAAQVFGPCGMHQTAVYNPLLPKTAIPNRAMGYAPVAGGGYTFADQSIYSATQGDGCIYTSGHEYRLWDQAIQAGGLFPVEPLLAQVQAPVQDGKHWFYGMGWFFSTRQDGSYELYHTGNSCGFSHLVVRIPREQTLIMAFSNEADHPILLPQLLQDILRHSPISLESDLMWELPQLTR
jgi:CubicO group peptidase (beta-lactamase class C family)